MVKVSEQFPNVKFGFCRHTVTTRRAYHMTHESKGQDQSFGKGKGEITWNVSCSEAEYPRLIVKVAN